jgi:hypothetical protein
MRIILDLANHCVETEAKKIYEEGLKEYFRSPESKKPELEEKIEGLKNFLEYSDFKQLRSCNTVLSGGAEDGKAILRIMGRESFEVDADGIIFTAQRKKRQ